MNNTEWIDLAKALAWPLFAFAALAYIWRSDAIGSLLKISESVDQLREKLSELVKAEERLKETTLSIGETIAVLDQLGDLVLMKADIESIRDKVDQRDELQHETMQISSPSDLSLNDLLIQIETAWTNLTDSMHDKLGWFDKRKTGSEAYRFAHGNRKGIRLTYDQADEIARLHSSIKSYRRRQSTIGEWLNREVSEDFVKKCLDIVQQLKMT